MTPGDKVYVTKYSDPTDLGTVVGPSRLGEGCWIVEFPVHKTDQMIRIPWHESEITVVPIISTEQAVKDTMAKLIKELEESDLNTTGRGLKGSSTCLLCKGPMEKVLVQFNPRRYETMCTNVSCFSNQPRN